jgi:hypothetical protein
MSTAATGLILRHLGAGQPGDQAGLHDARPAGHGTAPPVTAASVLAAISAAMLAPLPGRAQRRAEGQDDREPGQGSGEGHCRGPAWLPGTAASPARTPPVTGKTSRRDE